MTKHFSEIFHIELDPKKLKIRETIFQSNSWEDKPFLSQILCCCLWRWSTWNLFEGYNYNVLKECRTHKGLVCRYVKIVFMEAKFIEEPLEWFKVWSEFAKHVWHSLHLNAWDWIHLKSGGWYIDLPLIMIPYEDKVLYEECQQLIENPIETHVWTVDQTVVEELSKLFEVVMEILTLGGNSKKHLRPLGGWSIF